MIQRLLTSVPDLGRDTAGDATGLPARRQSAAKAAEEERDGLPQASEGRKEYTDENGQTVITGLTRGADVVIDGQRIAGGIFYANLEVLDIELGRGADTLVVESTHLGQTRI